MPIRFTETGACTSISAHIAFALIDNTLSVDAHVNSVCKAANYHAKALRHIRKRVTIDIAVFIATTMVEARLDYCNAILYGTSANIYKLQLVQNFIARIVTGTKRARGDLNTLDLFSLGFTG